MAVERLDTIDTAVGPVAHSLWTRRQYGQDRRPLARLALDGEVVTNAHKL
jgi:hypothetical protein